MRADHLLHAVITKGAWFHLTLECIAEVGEHYHLSEAECRCICAGCADGDHWDCTNDDVNNKHAFDGNAPCRVERGDECWVHLQDCPIEETLTGEWPEGTAWPVPVVCDYNGDGEWETRYAPPEVAT